MSAAVAAVLAVDAGTSGVRAIAFDEAARPLASSFRQLAVSYPRPGWVEQDPLAIWEAVAATLADTASRLGRAPAAIGVANQRETALAWDRRSGRPLGPAIVWQDRRTAGRCAELAGQGMAEELRRRTGLVLDPYFSATKYEWVLGALGARPAGLALGTVDSWLVWMLTGGPEGGRFATDVSNASRTMLAELGGLGWSEDLCRLFGVPRGALAELVPSSGRLGLARFPGLEGVPVSGVAGDQQAALFGQACFEPGMTKNTYGTGSFVVANAGHAPPQPPPGLLASVAWQLGSSPPAYALEGAIYVTGAALGWLADQMGLIAGPDEAEALAASVADTAGAYLVPAFSGLASPYWDPWARGALVGASRGFGRAHLVRAAVEAMAYQTKDVLDAMRAGLGRPVGRLRVDGGASVMDLLLQFQADLAGCAVERSALAETTALGAAWLAGLAEGVWASPGELAGLWSCSARFEPSRPPGEAAALHGGWRAAVERCRGWARPQEAEGTAPA
ncbi:MAG TPA: glycerol kinase GlpK [Acidimicrobiales bacterium]|nr:glycerol kinase GlpK [Acidimicrobiales bacterium]